MEYKLGMPFEMQLETATLECNLGMPVGMPFEMQFDMRFGMSIRNAT